MRTLIYSDVHGNLPAFEAVLKHSGRCDAYICLGDLVNYGPWSNECVDLALSLDCGVLLMGNHEEAFIHGFYPGSNELVKQFFAITHPTFNRLDAIKQFKPDYKLGDYTCTHTILNQYIYPDTSVQLDGNYMIGHSHHQFIYRSQPYTLYNAGSVGQNRKIINVASYLLYDDESHSVEMQNVVYPFDLLIKEMKLKNYPPQCLDYYLNKQQI